MPKRATRGSVVLGMPPPFLTALAVLPKALEVLLPRFVLLHFKQRPLHPERHTAHARAAHMERPHDIAALVRVALAKQYDLHPHPARVITGVCVAGRALEWTRHQGM